MKTIAVLIAVHLIVGVVVYFKIAPRAQEVAPHIPVVPHLASSSKHPSSVTPAPTASTPAVEVARQPVVALPAGEREKLKAIYDRAPEWRATVDRKISGSSAPTRVDNNSESPKLEAILKRAGWDSPTVTEGVKLITPDGFTFRLEVIDGNAQDWYVAIETDRSLSSGRVVTKSKHSPW